MPRRPAPPALRYLSSSVTALVMASLSLGSSILFSATPAEAQPADPPAGPRSATPPPDPPPLTASTEIYTVVTGDSCRSIASRVLRSPQALAEMHRLNPQLGPTPHALVAGQKLLIPKLDRTPDAKLTAARGDVAVRDPKKTEWDPAKLDMGLWTSWRVGARVRASAEVTFQDQSQLKLRENTVVIIYGPSTPRQPKQALRAEIEGGSLEARLAAASGGPNVAKTEPLIVVTPSALAVLATGGSSLFSVDPAGVSLVANHEGAPVAVRSVTANKQPRGNPVRVASGMGSRVEKGKLPEPPRPLPPAPAFTEPRLVLATFAAASSVKVAWPPVASAVRYRATVFDASGAEQNAVLIPPGETSFELAAVPPGEIEIRVSSIDATGFEGAPSKLAVQVVRVAMAPPGAPATAPATTTNPTTPATTATTPSEPVRVALGSRLLPPAGMSCVLVELGADGAILAPTAAATPTAPTVPTAPADALARRPGRYLASCGPERPATGQPVPAAGSTGSPRGNTTATSSGHAGFSSIVEVVAIAATPVGSPAPLPRGARTELSIAVTSAAPLPPNGAGLIARGSAGLTVESQRWESQGNALRLIAGVRPAEGAATLESISISAAEVELTSVAIAVAEVAPPLVARPTWSLELGGFAGLILPPDGSAIGDPGVTRDELASGPLFGVRLAARQLARPWLAGRVELGGAALSQVGTPNTATFLLPSAAIAVRPLSLGAIELWAYGGAGLASLATAPNTMRTENALSLDGGAGILVRNAGLAFRLDATLSLLDPSGDSEVWPSVRLGISSTYDR